MKCPGCGNEKPHKNGTSRDGTQQYHCKSCGKYFCEHTVQSKPKFGITLDQFRDKHDVAHIVKKVLESLDPELIYEKNDIYQMAKLGASCPGLKDAIESNEKYYGKVAGGKLYFSHPDTIARLKDQVKMT